MKTKTRFSLVRGCVMLAAVWSFAMSSLHASGYEDQSASIVAGYAQSLKYEGISSAVVGFSTGGVTRGKHGSGEISIEWLAGRWKTNRYDTADRLVDTSRELHMPVMLNYRYSVRLPVIPVSLYAGAGAGVHMITNSFDSEFWTIYADPDTGKPNGWHEFFRRFDYSLTASGMAGVSIRVRKNAGIDIGVRWVWQGGSWHTFDDVAGGARVAGGAGAVVPADRTVWTRQDFMRMVTVSAHWVF